MVSLNRILQAGTPRRAQLNLIDIFNVVDTLKQRGFTKVSESTIEDTLLYADDKQLFRDDERTKIAEFLNKFNTKPYRVAVRNAVFGNASTVDLERLGGLNFSASPQNQEKYSKTVELLLAYLCVQELSAFSASFGVHVDGAPEGGDYDCIANFQNSLYHFEVKSGAVNNISDEQLQNFLYRHDFLCPEASVLFLDYGKINDNVIRHFLGLKLHANRTAVVSRILKCSIGGQRAFMMYPGILAVDIANNNDTLTNIRFAMQFLTRYEAWRRSALWDLVKPTDLGLEGETLESEHAA
jgi:hypothetical protein